MKKFIISFGILLLLCIPACFASCSTITAKAAELNNEQVVTTTFQFPTLADSLANIIVPEYEYAIKYNITTGEVTITQINKDQAKLTLDMSTSIILKRGETTNLQVSYIPAAIRPGTATTANYTIGAVNPVIDLSENLISSVQITGHSTSITNFYYNLALAKIDNDGNLEYATIFRAQLINGGNPIIPLNVQYYNWKYINTGAYTNTQAIWNNGYAEGYNEAYGQFYESRWNAGYAAGQINGAANANEYTFLGLLNAVFYAPLKAFTSMLNFNLFGVNMLGIVTAILTLAIVVQIIKVVL